jgi:rhodanese-related sulfurtransferase
VKATRVDGATAKALVKDGARLVDVRSPQEFAAGHVPGAVNIPYDEVERRAAEVGPPSTPVVLYCRTGRRSGIAAETLERLGYRHVYDLGPMTAWPGTPQ